MASLSTILSHLATIRQSSEQPLSHSGRDIRALLEGCSTPEDISRWHLGNIAWVRKNPDCELLENLVALCENVKQHLLDATQQLARLWKMASEQECLQKNTLARPLLNAAIENIERAFQRFTIVEHSNLRSSEVATAVVMTYLVVVYQINIIVIDLAFPSNTVNDYFDCWKDYLNTTKLKGFVFQDKEELMRTWRADRTLRAVLAPPNAMPEAYLPAHPGPPAPVPNFGPYGAPVLRNALFFDRNVQGN